MNNDLISRKALIKKATGNDIYGMVDIDDILSQPTAYDKENEKQYRMTEHDGCTGCKHFNSQTQVSPESPCYDCENAHTNAVLTDKYEPMSNADYIRRISDEDLAKYLACLSCEGRRDCNEEGQEIDITKNWCKVQHDMITEWLQREA